MHKRSSTIHDGAGPKAAIDDQLPVTFASLEAALANFHERASTDPFSNPIVFFAIDLSRRIDRGERSSSASIID